MSHTCTKVTVRQRAIRNNRISLYLDYYPREKILLYYDKEIPYSVEVVVEEFKEEPKKIHIRAVINVERDSQKGIIIGKQGKALKKVATEARRELERFFGKTIFLETYVKVDKDWRSSDKELRNFGYQLD